MILSKGLKLNALYIFQKVGVAPILSELEKLGGWPLLEGENWKEKNFTLNTASEFMKNGHKRDYIFNLYVQEDLKNSTRRVIRIGRGNLRIPDEVFFMVSNQSNPEHLQHFKIFI